MDVETADDEWSEQRGQGAITKPEPLAVRLGGVGEDVDLLEGYVGMKGGDGCTLIASTDDGEAVMRMTRTDMRRVVEWLTEVEAEQDRAEKIAAAERKMKELGYRD